MREYIRLYSEGGICSRGLIFGILRYFEGNSKLCKSAYLYFFIKVLENVEEMYAQHKQWNKVKHIITNNA